MDQLLSRDNLMVCNVGSGEAALTSLTAFVIEP